MRKKEFRIIPLLLLLLVWIISLHNHGLSAEVTGKNGVVVSVDRYASQVGIDILKKGGNAVDAAVAVGFVLAVTFPPAGNIGGGGFMIVRFPETGDAVALDFREKAPGKAKADMYLDEEGEYVMQRSLFGHLAVGVPGTVKGFELAMKKYGKLSWQEVINPAIELAEKGFELNDDMARSFNRLKKNKLNSKEFLRIFSKTNGKPFQEGDNFVQKDLAESLKLIAQEGSKAFYEGEIADFIVKDMQKYGGLITKKDLTTYEAFVRTPVTGNYRGFQIISMPPPSSGGTILLEMLNILEGFELGKMQRFGPEAIHLVSETMKFAYLDRAKYLGDSDFGDIPVKKLISKDHADEIRKKLDLKKAVSSKALGKEILTLEESKETTHYSVIDKEGIAVSVTYTLNGGFGAGVISEGTGILMNNEMADFNMRPGHTDDKGLIGTKPNLIEPHKRMLSSMTPTIVVRDGKTLLITGSPGGRTIINTVLNVIINVLDFKMSIQDAVNACRIDHEWMPDILRVEKDKIPKMIIDALKAMGHDVRESRGLGDAHSIWIDPKTGVYHGAADKRSEGTAVGY
jgi:gamma-glutamyltranspeptidase/glutathione hydrolase